MADSKEPNDGSLPCLVCGEPQNYLTTSHMETHDKGKPQDIAAYRDQVAENAGLDRSHPAVASNQLLKPQLWRANDHLFEGWEDWTWSDTTLTNRTRERRWRGAVFDSVKGVAK